jgi:hypothetical protein
MYNIKYYSYYIMENSYFLCDALALPGTRLHVSPCRDVNSVYRGDIICWNDLKLIWLRRGEA